MKSQLARYIIVGGTSYLIEIGLVLFLLYSLSLSKPVAISIGFWVGLIVSFALQKVLAFKNISAQPLDLSRQGAYYGLLVLFNYFFTVIFVEIFTSALGLVVARTAALAITTVWNYFIYQKVIFPNKSNLTKNPIATLSFIQPRNIAIAIMAIFSISLLTSLSTNGIMARPVGDDLSFFIQHDKNNLNVLDTVSEHYLTHNGRLGAATFVYAMYSLFGESSTRVAPLVLLLLLVSSMSVLTMSILPRKTKNPIFLSILLGLTFTTSAIFTAPSLFDDLYWLTSSSVYIPSLISLALTTFVTLMIIRYESWRGWRRALLIAPVLVIGQMFGEGGAVTSIAVATCLVVATFIFRSRIKNAVLPSLVVWASLLTGFLTNYLSPATRARRDHMNAPLSISDVVHNTLTPYQNMINGLQMWHILLAAFIGVSMFIIISRSTPASTKRTERSSLYTQTFAILCLFLAPFITFVINAVSSGQYFAQRNYLVPHFLFFAAISLLFFTASSVASKYISKRYTSFILMIVAVMLIAISLPSIIIKQKAYIQSMSLRDTMFTQRALSIKRQQDLGSTEISVEPLPPLIVRSDAVDLVDPKENYQIDWLVGSIIKYYSIKKLRVISADKNYCLTSHLVRSDYMCQHNHSHTPNGEKADLVTNYTTVKQPEYISQRQGEQMK